MEFFCRVFSVIEPTKQSMGPGCKILLWYSSSATAMPAHLTEYDFTAIAEEIYSDEARRAGRSMDDILTQVGLLRINSFDLLYPFVHHRYI
jgi:hypothetical protein